jgi:predicted nucleotidyltransferase
VTRQEAEQYTILRCLVGSTAHGLNVQDAIEDRDEMGVLLEPLHDAIGVGASFEQFIYRTAAEREHKHDAKSRAGDLDLVLYSLRKWCRLALHGNPTVLMMLFAEPLQVDARGAQLRELAPAFASKQAGKRFLGYLTAQKQRLIGERGQKDVRRPELEEKYGFDTKYAMHMLRLGMQGVEYLSTGTLTLPMEEPTRTWLRGVRTGESTLQQCLTRVGELEVELRDLIDTSPLPDTPDSDRVEQWMCNLYLQNWKAREPRVSLCGEIEAARVSDTSTPHCAPDHATF